MKEGALFAIEKKTVEIGTIPRKVWRHSPTIPPTTDDKDTHRIQLTLEEFSRPWRAFRFTKKSEPPDHARGEHKKDAEHEIDVLHHYEPSSTSTTHLFPHELHAPSNFRDVTTVDGSTPYKVSVKLAFNVGAVEPVVCRLSLFDVHGGCRASEDFTFMLNPSLSSAKDARRLIKGAIFYVLPNLSLQNLYLVLQTSKVLQGDIEVATLPYCQPERYSSEAELAKLVDKAAECCARLGNIRQGLAWGATSLTDGVKQMILYRQKASLNDEQKLAWVAEASKGALKERTVPCVCELDIEKMDEVTIRGAKKRSMDMKISTSAPGLLYVVDPMFHDPPKDMPDALHWCREIQPFCQPQSAPIWGPTGSGPIAVSFVHIIYVYSIAVERFQHRNIAIKVQLLHRSSEIAAIYNDEATLTTEAICDVTYHNKAPPFQDEIKIALPLPLSQEHSLVFTFYHVHCKKMPPGKLPMDIVGRSVMPLLDSHGVLLPDGPHSLPVVTDGDAKGTNAAFQCRSRILSSVYSQDPVLQAFFHVWQTDALHEVQSVVDDRVVKSRITSVVVERISDLKNAGSVAVRFHLLRLLRQLLAYLCHDRQEIRSAAFLACLNVFDKCTSSGGTPRKSSTTATGSASSSASLTDATLVLQYIDTIFDEPEGNNNTIHVYQAVVAEWTKLMAEPTSSELRKLVITHANALLHLVAKSLALQGTQPLPHPAVSVDLTVVSALLDTLFDASLLPDDGFIIRKDMLQSLAQFALTLFYIVESPLPALWIQRALPRLAQTKESAILIHMTFPFIKILAESDSFVAINTTNGLMSDIPHAWLAQLLCKTLVEIVHNQTEDKIKSHAIAILRRLLVVQMRGQHKERVALMFLPVLQSLLTLTTRLDDEDNEAFKRDTLMSLTACLSLLSEKQLKGFWKPTGKSTEFDDALQNHVHACIRALRHAMDCFLGDGLPWQQILSPDCVMEQGKQPLSLLDIEHYMKQRNHRRTNDMTHRSLPRNWGKNYLAQRKHSMDLKSPTSPTASDDPFSDMEDHARNVCTGVARTLVKTIQTLIHDFSRHLIAHPSLLATVVDLWFLLLTRIGHGHFDADVVSTVLTHLTAFVGHFQRPLFASKLMIDDAWCERLVLLAASASTAAPLAAAFLCDLLATCFDQLGSFVRVQTSVLTVVAKHLALPTLAGAFDSMELFPTNDTTVFRPQLWSFIDFLRHLHSTWARLGQAKDDKEHDQDLEDDLASIVMAIAPEELWPVQMKFLEALIQLHVDTKQIAEAARCHIFAAAMARRAILPSRCSDACILNHLKLAITQASCAQLPDFALAIAEDALVACKRLGDYVDYACILQLMEPIAKLAQADTMLPMRYFAVSVVGLLSPTPTEYIYKRSAFCHITDVMEAVERDVRRRFSKHQNVSDNLTVKPISAKSDHDNAETTLYIKATPVEPAFSGSCGREFMLSAPFSIQKHQFVRKTLLRVRDDFPALSTRQAVVSKEEEIRCPIDTAVDDIERRTLSLEKIVARDNRGCDHDMKGIMLLLKGSINTEVHGGAPEVINLFLTPNAPICVDDKAQPMAPSIQRVKQAQLRKKLLRFLQVALQVLVISRELCRRAPNEDPDGQAPLQLEFEKGFVKILDALAATVPPDTQDEDMSALQAAVAFKFQTS
ncbi:hypothetical protein AC1031_014933 [Aphanomyces cochlioides]|nr:hypothetical protein AC1031_014933 [Aphanomyces cochlioides]